MKILIIEDEIPAAEQLINILTSISPGVELLGVVESNRSLSKWLASNERPELIFSDIELLDGPVFETFRKTDPGAPVIFVTAYDNFMLQAFETHGISYLLKPFTADDISRALEKYGRLTSPQKDMQKIMDQLRSVYVSPSYKARFTVRMGQGIYLLETRDIACIRMKNGVVHAYNEKGKAFILNSVLTSLYSELDPSLFYMINRGEVVNINFIEKIEPYVNDRLAIAIKGQADSLITSNSRTPAFRKWLES